MSFNDPYADKERRLKLERAFCRVSDWAATKAAIAGDRGEHEDMTAWLKTSFAATKLAGVARAKNLVSMVENTPPLREPFTDIIEKLNDLSILPPNHPDRNDASLRTAARRIAHFRKHVGEGLDCNNPFQVPDCQLKH